MKNDIKDLIHDLFDVAVKISEKEGGIYHAWIDYSGHVNLVTVRIALREPTEDVDWLFYERIWLSKGEAEIELLRAYRAFLNYLEV